MEKEENVVWISKEQKIASFHAQEGMEKKCFASKGEFMEYLRILTEKHYRFT